MVTKQRGLRTIIEQTVEEITIEYPIQSIMHSAFIRLLVFATKSEKKLMLSGV